MFNSLKSLAVTGLKRARLYANRQGYDFHPVDSRCWEDQVAILRGQETAVIFDIGANGGEVAIEYRRLFPKARVFCFEPQHECVEVLKGLFRDDSLVSIHPVAVGAKRGSATFHVTGSRASSSLLRSDQDHLPPSYRQILTVAEEREVEVITLDEFAEREDLKRIDVLKLDIQGGEYAALEGAQRLLSEGRVRLIYLEIGFVPMYVNHPLLGDLTKLLARHDYTLHFLYNLVINGRSGRMLWGDAIFISPGLYRDSRERLKQDWGGKTH